MQECAPSYRSQGIRFVTSTLREPIHIAILSIQSGSSHLDLPAVLKLQTWWLTCSSRTILCYPCSAKTTNENATFRRDNSKFRCFIQSNLPCAGCVILHWHLCWRGLLDLCCGLYKPSHLCQLGVFELLVPIPMSSHEYHQILI